MTTKEIAEAAGVSTDTVIRKAKELYPLKFEHGKRAVFLQKEAIAIMAYLRKKGFVELPQNASDLTQNASVLTEKDLSIISALTAGIVSQIMANLDKRVEKIEGRIEQRQALLPAPQIKSRDHISMIVRAYCKAQDRDFSDAWNELYREHAYRTNTNPKAAARNRAMTTLDYIEAEGMIETLEAIALDVFGAAV